MSQLWQICYILHLHSTNIWKTFENIALFGIREDNNSLKFVDGNWHDAWVILAEMDLTVYYKPFNAKCTSVMQAINWLSAAFFRALYEVILKWH